MHDYLDGFLIAVRVSLKAGTARPGELATEGVRGLEERLLHASVGAENTLRCRILDIICAVTSEVGTVGEEVNIAPLEDEGSLHVACVIETLAVQRKELYGIASPFDTFLSSGVSYLADLQEVFRDLGLVDNILLSISVLEPGRVDNTRRSSVTLHEVALGVVYALHIVTDGGSNAVFKLLAIANGLLVVCCEVPAITLVCTIEFV